MEPAHTPTLGCPACGNTLVPITVADVTVDVCQHGCAGIWFDRAELARFDERHEPFPEALLTASAAPGVQVFPKDKRHCPRCLDPVLYRFFFTADARIEVDQCPACGGWWLDSRELQLIREAHDNRLARDRARQDFLKQLPRQQVTTEPAVQDDRVNRAQTIDALLRLVGSKYRY